MVVAVVGVVVVVVGDVAAEAASSSRFKGATCCGAVHACRVVVCEDDLIV